MGHGATVFQVTTRRLPSSWSMFSIDAGLMISMILAVAAAEPHLREVAPDGSVSAMTLAGLVVGD